MSTFRVAQYNVLGRSFSLVNYFPYAKFYITEGQSDLDWARRSRKLRESIEKLEADIYCLCEVDEPDICRLDTHDFVYQQRPKRPDGCLVMWRRSAFSLVSKCHLEFPKTDRIALAVELHHLSSGLNFRVIGTHLFWNKASDLQLNEARLLKQFISDLPPLPTVLAGDLNNTRSSETFAVVASSPNFKDVFTLRGSEVPEFTSVVPATDSSSGRKEEIDFIIASADTFAVEKAGVLIEGDLKDGIPNQYHGSDHLPVFADLRVNNIS
jgi:endonuclease/exonuclease/phosphatase family metal-dependent hydrolase